MIPIARRVSGMLSARFCFFCWVARMSADITAGTGDRRDLRVSASRADVPDADAARNRAHAPVRRSCERYKDGEALFETGKPGPGMFVVLSGHVAITQRDGLGHVTPVIDQGPGQFLAEIGQLSGRVALVDGHAEGDVETLLIPPEQLRALLVAEADLGERIMRALILRRVSLIQAGVGGPVLIGPAVARRHGAAAEFPGAQRPAAPSCSIPPTTRTPPISSRAMRPRAPICRWSCVPTARCCATRRRPRWRWRIGMIDQPCARQALRRRRGRQRARRPCHRGLCGVRRTVGRRARLRARSAARPAPARASKTISASRPAFPARRWPAAPTIQAQKFGAEMLIPVAVRSLDCSRARRRCLRWRPNAGSRCARIVVVASGARYRRPDDREPRRLRRPRRLVLGLADRGAGCAPSRRSCWSAAAIPPARPRCSCPAMRARST